MPIYEYRCSACRHELEALHKFSDAPLTKCPQCGKAALTKLVSAAGFHLKGSGWYQTDFRGNGRKPAAKPDGGDASGKPADTGAKAAESGGAAKAETPAAKSDTPATPASSTTPATP